MNYTELLNTLNLSDRDIIVTVINPIRNGEYYKTGRLTGFKIGLWNANLSKYKMGWVKKPKIHVTYNVFKFGGKELSDWIDIDNCAFEYEYRRKEISQ